MAFYLTPAGLYYEGDRADPNDQPCAQHPSSYHVFTGTPSLDHAVCWRVMTQAEKDSLMLLTKVDEIIW